MARIVAQDFPQAYSLEQARFVALAKGWPALYVALCAVLSAVAFVHAQLTPWWAWAMFPIFLVPKAVLWFAMWRGRRNPVPSSVECARAVRILGIEVVFCVAGFITWEVWLTKWSTPVSTLLLALCMGGQMVFIIFGLLHLRMASVLAAGFCVLGMAVIAFGAGGIGDATSYTMGVVILLVGGLTGLSYIAYSTYEDFNDLVTSRLELMRQNKQITALGEETLRIANTDMLTEIGNRRSCFHELDKALTSSRESGEPVSFGVIDLDGFKAVNDTNGHLVGDRLLRAMAERLKSNLAARGEVFRLGGDEFAFIVPGTDDDEKLLSIGQEVIASVQQPIHVSGLNLTLGCSVGFASFPKTAISEVELYDRADYVLYQAKRTGRAKTVVFNNEHRRVVEASGLIENALRTGDLAAELFLDFQPIVDPGRNTTVILEALARWQSPELGLVLPSRFMGVAEQSSLASTLTSVLFGKALEAASRWPDEVGLSFKLTKSDVLAPEMTLGLIGSLARSGLSPGRVSFRIPEAVFARNPEVAMTQVRQLRATGVHLVLDGFATGRSNVDQIRSCAFERIGFDLRFMPDFGDDDTSRTMVRSIVSFAREWSIECIVAGVDTREQFDLLRGLEGVLVQGDFASAPMAADEVLPFLERASGPAPRSRTA